MSIAIIKYNAGNIFSVECALKRIGAEAIVTDNPQEILSADKVIFPGVGEAATAMNHLSEHGLDSVIKNVEKPLLGICIGMQLLCNHSEEGDIDCLGIFDTEVKKFRNEQHPEFKIPHMGWNEIHPIGSNPLLHNCSDSTFVYYVHSYYIPVNQHTIATTNYIHDYSAALNYKNFFATQFHPEKSGSIGETILKNFLDL